MWRFVRCTIVPCTPLFDINWTFWPFFRRYFERFLKKLPIWRREASHFANRRIFDSAVWQMCILVNELPVWVNVFILLYAPSYHMPIYAHADALTATENTGKSAKVNLKMSKWHSGNFQRWEEDRYEVLAFRLHKTNVDFWRSDKIRLMIVSWTYQQRVKTTWGHI